MFYSLSALMALLAGLWTFDPKLGLSGDNAEFMVLARSLVEGHGWTYINDPAMPLATKFPPGFPLLIAPLAWLWPGSWLAVKVLVLVMFAASAPVFWRLAQPLGKARSVAATLLYCTCPLLVSYASQEMSEIPYVLVSLLALWCVQRGWFWRSAACLVGAYYLRSMGVMLIAAVVLEYLLRRDWRHGLLLAGVTALAALPWLLHGWILGGNGYVWQFLAANPYYPDLGMMSAHDLLTRMHTNLMDYGYLADWGLCVLAALLGYSWGRHRQWTIYAILHLLVILVWPWPGDRFIVPILPVLLLLAVDVVRLPCPLAHWFIYGMALGTQIIGLGAYADQARSDYPPAWRDYVAASQWLKANTPTDAVICGRKAYLTAVVADRRCVCYPFAGPDSVMRVLGRVDYVIVDVLGFASTPRHLLPALDAHPERFAVVQEYSYSAVLQVRP